MRDVDIISFHSSLLSASVEFLHQEDMRCVVTQEAIPELIGSLLNYQEEGKSLFPDIYIFDDIKTVRKVIGNSQFCHIGKGEKTKDTLALALKKCAPLTEKDWSMYILRQKKSFEYGIFRGGDTLISVSISEILVDNVRDKESELKAILIHQISDKLIEIKGTRANTLLISYGVKINQNGSPLLNQLKFIESIVSKVDVELIERAKNFFKKLFLEVSRKGHGTLACVVSDENKLPDAFKDSIILQEKISIPNLIQELLELDVLPANARLEGYFNLIAGMMQSDGITIFTNRGEVIGYNVFLADQKVVDFQTNGGARTRTYINLCNYIGDQLDAAYIQSHDGKINYKHGK